MSDEFPFSVLESPALFFLARLLNPAGLPQDLTVPSEFGKLTFREMDLLQERGRLPVLQLDFEFAEGLFQALYYGHISPFKLGSVRIIRAGEPEKEYVFSEAGRVLLPMKYSLQPAELPQGLDWKILAGSLYLWRSCCGLPDVCDPSLGKYFSKMKSVSRYSWENVSYEMNGDIVMEEWSTCVIGTESAEKSISVTLQNGSVSNVVA